MRTITLDLTDEDREALAHPHLHGADVEIWRKSWPVDGGHYFEVVAYGGAPHEAHLDPTLVEKGADDAFAGDVETFDVVDSIEEIDVTIPYLDVRVVGAASPAPAAPAP